MDEQIEKVKTIEELAVIAAAARAKELCVVQCHGVFDLLHPGHIRHLYQAKKMGDMLIVTLTGDEFVNKGPGRPVFNQRLRSEAVAALENVDYVAVVPHPTAIEAIRELHPNLFVKGHDQFLDPSNIDEPLADEAQAVRLIGGKLCFTEEITFSSTRLLNDYFGVFSSEAELFLGKFRQRWSAHQVIEKLEALKDLRVLILGDIIVDEYHYCKAVGKSSKSPTLTARFLSAERHAGGVLAVANHVAGFAGEVHLLTYLGNPEIEETFVRNNLRPNVRAQLVRQMGRTPVVKRRYIDPFQSNKMFEVMWLDGDEPIHSAENELLTHLKYLSTQCDMIIIADFGHGNVGTRTIEELMKVSSFLAINAQSNSANMGYNLITKYSRADYLCIDEEEMRLACHSRKGDLSKLTEEVANRMGCQMVSVTRGTHGSLTFKTSASLYNTPIFSSNVVDSVGAGDAYLSVTSLCAKKGYESELIGFIGNCVGALAVRVMGNRVSVEPPDLYQFIKTLLK